MERGNSISTSFAGDRRHDHLRVLPGRLGAPGSWWRDIPRAQRLQPLRFGDPELGLALASKELTPHGCASLVETGT